MPENRVPGWRVGEYFWQLFWSPKPKMAREKFKYSSVSNLESCIEFETHKRQAKTPERFKTDNHIGVWGLGRIFGG